MPPKRKKKRKKKRNPRTLKLEIFDEKIDKYEYPITVNKYYISLSIHELAKLVTYKKHNTLLALAKNPDKFFKISGGLYKVVCLQMANFGFCELKRDLNVVQNYAKITKRGLIVLDYIKKHGLIKYKK